MKPAGYIMWKLHDIRLITTVLGRVCYIDHGNGWRKLSGGGSLTLDYIRRNYKKVCNLTKEDLMLELL